MEGGRQPPADVREAEHREGQVSTSLVSPEDQLAHVWRLFLHGQEELRFASLELENLRQHLAEEMREVENYVDHVRTLTKARDAVAAEYARENEHLKTAFIQLQLQQDSQHKEVEEMLKQEGMFSIVHSSPSEQVAYFLVERSSLLEKIKALEQELGASHCLGRRTWGVHLQFSSEEQARESVLHDDAKQDLDAAPVVQCETQSSSTRNEEPGKLNALELQITRKHSLQLGETLLLPDRFCSLDLAKKVSLEQEVPSGSEGLLSCGSLLQPSEDNNGMAESGGATLDCARCQTLHKRCFQATEGIEDQRSQLLHQLQGGEGRDEELQVLLGETPSECQPLDHKVDRLQKKSSHLDVGLCKAFDMGEEETTKQPVDCQKELHNYKSELLHLYGELQVFQEAAEERDFLHQTHKKLLKKNVLLETKLLELSHECECLNQSFAKGQKKWGRRLGNRMPCPELPANVQGQDNQIQSPEEESKQVCIILPEFSKMEEPERQLQKEILALQCQLNAHNSAVTERSKPDTGFGDMQLSKLQVPKGSADGDTEWGPPSEGLLQQNDDLQRLWWDFQQLRDSYSSAEKQLRIEQEKNFQLKKQNLQLQQESIKVQAELRQVNLRLLDSSQACESLASQGELYCQKVQELELQLLQQSQDAKQQSSWQEQLAQERERTVEAKQRVLELQQLLQEAQHQGQLLENSSLERKRLTEEVREAQEKEAEAQQHFQEEHEKRKLLEQQLQDQLQQLRSLQEKETQLAHLSTERQVWCQQQEAHLRVLEEEKNMLSDEHLHCQNHHQKLFEQLSALQEEKEALCEEQRQVLKQVDISLRKHNEQSLRHKTKLRRMKDMLLREVKQRNRHISHLENELQLSKCQAEKDHMLIEQVTSENKGLFQEKRKILEQLHNLEEAKLNNSQILCTIQSRVQLLDEENQRLQERTLQLSTQVGILERALRSIHIHNLEELKSLGFPNCLLQRRLLLPPFPRISFSVTGISDSCSLLKVIKDGPPTEPGKRMELSPLSFQTSEISCLNVSVPRDLASFPNDESGNSFCGDHV